MKQELKDAAIEITKATPAVGAAWWANVSLTTILTICLITLQILYLLRKWWREETTVGQVMREKAHRAKVKTRAWADKAGITQPANLDD